MSRQGVIRSALVLTVCGILCKLLGAFYRVPLTNMLTAEGMGMYYLIFPVFSFLISLTSSSVPQVLSKLVAECVSNGNYKKAKTYFLCCIILFFSFGLLCSVVLFFIAPILSNIQNNVENLSSYFVIAPAIFLVAVISCFRGYFQGFQTMTQTGISQIIEQVFKIGLGLYLVNKFLIFGLEQAVFGAVFAITISEVFALGYLVVSYLFFKERKKNKNVTNDYFKVKQCFKDIIKMSIPFTLSYVIFPLSLFLDSIVVVRLLTNSNVPVGVATSVFGLYNGAVGTLTNFPIVISTAIAMAILPSISYDIKKGERDFAQEKILLSFKLGVFVLLPCVIVFSIFPKQILQLLFGEMQTHLFDELGVATTMLRLASIGVLFMGLFQISTAILQAENKTYVPVVSLVFGTCIRCIVLIVLLNISGINFYAIVIANIICYYLIAMRNVSFLQKDFCLKINFMIML